MISLRRLLALSSATGLCSLLLAGCPLGGIECRTTADCAAGEVCRENACIPAADDGVDAGPQADAGSPDDAGPPPSDAGPSDAGPGDAGPQDAGPQDAGPQDAGPQDAGLEDDAGDDDAG